MRKRLQRWGALVLSAVLVLTLLPGQAFADNASLVPPEAHNWSYTIQNSTLTAHCLEPNCWYSEPGVSITLRARDMEYDGTPYDRASIDSREQQKFQSDTGTVLSGPFFEQDGEPLGGPPTECGSYTVKYLVLNAKNQSVVQQLTASFSIVELDTQQTAILTGAAVGVGLAVAVAAFFFAPIIQTDLTVLTPEGRPVTDAVVSFARGRRGEVMSEVMSEVNANDKGRVSTNLAYGTYTVTVTGTVNGESVSRSRSLTVHFSGHLGRLILDPAAEELGLLDGTQPEIIPPEEQTPSAAEKPGYQEPSMGVVKTRL